MVTALFKKEMKSNWMLLVIFLAVLSMYGTMIVMMFDPKMGDSLQAMAESMPDLFAAFGMADVGQTLLEFVSGYLYGLLYVVFPCVYLIILTNRLAARYVDNGSMAYLLSVPEKRWKIMLTQAVFLIASLVLLTVYVTGLILAVSRVLFPGEMDVAGFLRLNVGLFGILLFFGGVCFLSSCIFNESKTALSVGTGVVVYSVLVQMVAQAGEKFADAIYGTPLYLFDVSGLGAGDESAWIKCGVLYGAGLIFMAGGIWRFSKRDLPL